MRSNLKIVTNEGSAPLPGMPERETIGQYFERKRKSQELSLDDLAGLIAERGGDVSPSNIRKIEAGSSPNPGIKTIGDIARGLGIDPLEAARVAFGETTTASEMKAEKEFAKTRLMRLWRLYEKAAVRQRSLVDDIVEMLIGRLSKSD